MRLRSVLRVAPAFVSPLLACAFVFVLACAGQQEGQACSTYNGNADCANGLVCTTLPGVNGSRCCPSDRNQSTTVACGTPSEVIATDSAAPPFDGDSGDGGDQSEASASEAATDDDAAVDDGAAAGDGAATGQDAAPDASPVEASADAASE